MLPVTLFFMYSNKKIIFVLGKILILHLLCDSREAVADPEGAQNLFSVKNSAKETATITKNHQQEGAPNRLRLCGGWDDKAETADLCCGLPVFQTGLVAILFHHTVFAGEFRRLNE